MPAQPFPLPEKNRRLTVLAWIVVALVSTLPEIILSN